MQKTERERDKDNAKVMVVSGSGTSVKDRRRKEAFSVTRKNRPMSKKVAQK